MPVVTVTVPAHPAIGRLLVDLADAVASPLGLGDGDVITVHVATGASARSGADAATDTSAWHIVGIHGSPRSRENMGAAARAAEASVREWCVRNRVECEGVWTQWLIPLPL